MDSSSFLDLPGLRYFKEKLLELVDEKLAGKQDAGKYLTANDVKDVVRFENVGEVRSRDTTLPTYGLDE